MSDTILTRPYTPTESHRIGDHRGCGSACLFSGEDKRSAPIYEAMVVENWACSIVNDMTMKELQSLARSAGLRYSHMRKAALRDLILDHIKSPAVSKALGRFI